VFHVEGDFTGSWRHNPKDWLEALDGTDSARGIIYTTWFGQYGLLAAFGDLVRREHGTKP